MIKLFVLYTGGTFGGIQTADGVAPASIEVLADILPNVEASVTIESFGRILDSSSIVPDDWVEMAKIIGQRYDDYDGFVILHGTDSMAFTSCALTWLIEGLDKPVVLTGSQVPLSFPDTDAVSNYREAIAFAGRHQPGVWIVFGGLQILGRHAVKVSCERWQAFGAPKETEIWVPDSRPFRVIERIEPDVRLVYCHPGLTADKLAEEILCPAKGLVIASYGIGNLPSGPAVERALSTAVKDQGKRIIQVTQCAHGRINPGVYATGRSLVRAGVEAGDDMTIEAALTYLMVTLG